MLDGQNTNQEDEQINDTMENLLLLCRDPSIQFDTLKGFLELHKDTINFEDDDHNNPIGMVIGISNNTSVIELLISYGLKLNASILNYTVLHGSLDGVTNLLSHGANPAQLKNTTTYYHSEKITELFNTHLNISDFALQHTLHSSANHNSDIQTLLGVNDSDQECD